MPSKTTKKKATASTARAKKSMRAKSSGAKKAPPRASSRAVAVTWGGISDDAVTKATGKSWREWCALLDARSARTLPHKSIAQLIDTEFGVGPWWSQMVTVGYEQARGLRQKHETTAGFSVSASRTIAAPLAEVWRAFDDPRRRSRWIGGVSWTATARHENKSLRCRFEDGPQRLEIAMYARGPEKTQAGVQHGKIPTEKEAHARKAFWNERLDALRDLLEARAR